MFVCRRSRTRGAQLVNEPGTLVFNGLNIRDMEGAEVVLRPGVRLADADPGQRRRDVGSAGYGDYLERDNPDLRKQLAEMGGPGYEDVVASIDPIPDDQPDPPAHWSVTFAVDDPNATAAKATKLGGTVIAPPTSSVVQARLLPGAPDEHQRPPGRDVQREQVRAGEQAPRQLAGRRAGRRTGQFASDVVDTRAACFSSRARAAGSCGGRLLLPRAGVAGVPG